MEDDLKKAYGSYDIPNEVYQLIKLEEELVKDGLTLATIGLIPSIEFEPYSITPPDLIPFASTGGDGIHFGFLTDFNEVSSLNVAPIVCVTPTNDPPIRYMARNIREFLSLAASVPYVEMLESCWDFKDEKQLVDMFKEFESDTPASWQKQRARIFTRFKETWELQPIELFGYLNDRKKERLSSCIISTHDGLGIVSKGKENGTNQRFTFSEQRTCDEKEIERMHLFLRQANKEEKLAFIRDANYWYILTSGYHEAVWELIIELLKSLEMYDDAERVFVRC